MTKPDSLLEKLIHRLQARVRFSTLIRALMT